jgi:hypothetical protein
MTPGYLQQAKSEKHGIPLTDAEIETVKQTCRQIPGMPENYWVSPDGLLYNIAYGKRSQQFKIRQPHRLIGALQNGYLKYNISVYKDVFSEFTYEWRKKSVWRQYDAATLVALAYIGPRPDPQEMCLDADIPIITPEEAMAQQKAEDVWAYLQSIGTPSAVPMTDEQMAEIIQKSPTSEPAIPAEPEPSAVTRYITDYRAKQPMDSQTFTESLIRVGLISSVSTDEDDNTEPF